MRWIKALHLKWRHKRAPRTVSIDPAKGPRFMIVSHVLDGAVYIDRIEDTERCVFGEEEWQGYFIGERWCHTHGGHSTDKYLCPRHPDRVHG